MRTIIEGSEERCDICHRKSRKKIYQYGDNHYCRPCAKYQYFSAAGRTPGKDFDAEWTGEKEADNA